VYIIKEEKEIAPALRDVAKYDRELLIEKFIAGRELTVGILGEQALPILEIIPKSGFYDFNNKYPFLNPGGARWRAARLSSHDSRRTDARDPGFGVACPPCARFASLLACRLDAYAPSRAVRSRGEHDSWDDRSESLARCGSGGRNQLHGTLRAHH
jgi:hypothetical protein